MLALRRWDPFKELSTIHREMDEFFKRTLESLTPGLFKGEWFPAVESYMKKNSLVVKVDLPGIDPKDLDISIVGNQLVIKGERKAVEEEKEGDYILKETAYGAFERCLTLPEGIDTEKVHASYKNGVLEITMPAKKEALPRKVTVEVEGKEAKRAA